MVGIDSLSYRQSKLHLGLVVPGLLGPRPRNTGPQSRALAALLENLSLPGLTSLLRWSVVAPQHPVGSLTELYFNVLGFPTADCGYPVAALTRQLDVGDAADGLWLRADPVILHADLRDLRLLEYTDLCLSLEDAQNFCGELNAYTAHWNGRLEARHPTRWYLRLPEETVIHTHAPYEALAQSIGAFQPTGADAGLWASRLTELQMVLHGSPVNRRRNDRGLPAINSLWLWGEGRLPAVQAPTLPSWRCVYADDGLPRALASGLGLQTRSAPANADVLWATSLPPRRGETDHNQSGQNQLAHDQPAHDVAPDGVLVVLDDLAIPCKRMDLDKWRENLVCLEQRWFSPLQAALNQHRLKKVSIFADEGLGLTIQRPSLAKRMLGTLAGRGDLVQLLSKLSTLVRHAR